MKIQALLFDCDGVLAETERDGHRLAYNAAMRELGIKADWSQEEYAMLLRTSGGKERLKYYFDADPSRFPPLKYNGDLIQEIYLKKTGIFKTMVNNNALPSRPGVARMIREAHENALLLFVCSTSHRESVETLLCRNYGKELFAWFTKLYCADAVAKKKPASDIYLLAKDEFGLDANRCFVIEDSRNGLLAARGAGMHCLITQSFYTVNEDFSGADIVTSCLGDPNGEQALILKSSRPIPQRGYITVADLDSLLQDYPAVAS